MLSMKTKETNIRAKIIENAVAPSNKKAQADDAMNLILWALFFAGATIAIGLFIKKIYGH